MSFLRKLLDKLPRVYTTVGIIFYTEGLLTGLSMKILRVSVFYGEKSFRLRIPFYPLQYNRAYGLKLREAIREIRELQNSKTTYSISVVTPKSRVKRKEVVTKSKKKTKKTKKVSKRSKKK